MVLVFFSLKFSDNVDKFKLFNITLQLLLILFFFPFLGGLCQNDAKSSCFSSFFVFPNLVKRVNRRDIFMRQKKDLVLT